ncbi:MAG: glycosyltransferase [Chloroflexota bacterium]
MTKPKIRILFNGHDFRFLQPVIDYFSNHSEYKVYIDKHEGHQIKDANLSQRLLEIADIIFCEWALGNAVWYSHHKMSNQFLIIRLHSQEFKTEYLEKILWKNVDKIIFICENNERRFLERFPHLSHLTTTIYNPLNCPALDQPKRPFAEYTLGFVGLSPMIKRPDIALDIFHQIKKLDERFTLIFKGKMPWEYDWLWSRPEERKFYDEFFQKVKNSEFREAIVFENYGNDMATFYSKVGYILSTSDHEGSHQSVAEGMASGAIPVIRNWAGADDIYPQKYIFNSIEKAVDLIQSTRAKEIHSLEAAFVKSYAYQNFDQSIIIPKYEEIFAQFEEKKQINLSPVTMNDLKVLIICYIRPNSHDGYVTRVIEEARLLRKKNIEVILGVFCHTDYFKNWDLISSHLVFLRNKTGAYVHLIPADDFFEISNILNGSDHIKRKIIELIDLYDVQIVHGESIYSSIYALQAAKESNVKFVFDVHGIAPEESEMNNEPAARFKALGKAEEKIIQASDAIVFVSNSMKEYFQRKYQSTFEKHVVIPTCVKTDLFTLDYENRINKRKELGLEGKFVFLYIGTLSVWQWKEAMFSLFEQVRKVNEKAFFFLVLPTSDHETAKELFTSKHISPEKYSILEISHDEIGSLIGIADAGILLRKEHLVNHVSFPTKFGEYLAAGVPVITTPHVGDISCLVEKNHLGIVLHATDKGVNEGEIEKLSRFMEEILTNREIWFDHCRNFAKEWLDWGLYIDRLIDTYLH